MKTLLSHKEKETIDFAKQIAAQLESGDILILTGELGSGKTKFTQGILSYFGLEHEISSPTFTIVNEYSSTPPIFHFDLYRLQSIDEFYEIGGEEYFEKGICIIEWGELIKPILPSSFFEITFEKKDSNEEERILQIQSHGEKDLIL